MLVLTWKVSCVLFSGTSMMHIYYSTSLRWFWHVVVLRGNTLVINGWAWSATIFVRVFWVSCAFWLLQCHHVDRVIMTRGGRRSHELRWMDPNSHTHTHMQMCFQRRLLYINLLYLCCCSQRPLQCESCTLVRPVMWRRSATVRGCTLSKRERL